MDDELMQKTSKPSAYYNLSYMSAPLGQTNLTREYRRDDSQQSSTSQGGILHLPPAATADGSDRPIQPPGPTNPVQPANPTKLDQLITLDEDEAIGKV